MLLLKGKVVRFRLSPEGEKALRGLFPRPSLQVRIEEIDELGAWILLDQAAPEAPKTVMLLKWDYFSTAVVEVEQEAPTSERFIGFKPQDVEEEL